MAALNTNNITTRVLARLVTNTAGESVCQKGKLHGPASLGVHHFITAKPSSDDITASCVVCCIPTGRDIDKLRKKGKTREEIKPALMVGYNAKIEAWYANTCRLGFEEDDRQAVLQNLETQLDKKIRQLCGAPVNAAANQSGASASRAVGSRVQAPTSSNSRPRAESKAGKSRAHPYANSIRRDKAKHTNDGTDTSPNKDGSKSDDADSMYGGNISDGAEPAAFSSMIMNPTTEQAGGSPSSAKERVAQSSSRLVTPGEPIEDRITRTKWSVRKDGTTSGTLLHRLLTDNHFLGSAGMSGKD